MDLTGFGGHHIDCIASVAQKRTERKGTGGMHTGERKLVGLVGFMSK